MQDLFPFYRLQRRQDLQVFRKALLGQFGPEAARVRGTIDEQLTGAILSGRTKDPVSFLAFLRLATHFHGDWNLLAQAPEVEILSPIVTVTHAPVKAHWLKLLWQKSLIQNGTASFLFLADWPVEGALHELEKNPGVGRKSSACTLNFSDARMPAFVVDTHVLRVLQRQGFVGPTASAKQAHEFVMQVAGDLTGDELFEFHWHVKRLGQQFCSHDEVACGCCPVASSCMKRLEPGVRRVLQPKPPEIWNGL